MLRNNPLESLRKFQMYLSDNRNRVLCYAIVHYIILFSHIRFYAFLLWQFLLPVKYICVECSVGNMNCPIVSYPVIYWVILYFPVTFFMPPTQNSIFGELLYKRYKGRIIYIVLSYFEVYFVILLYSSLTVIPPVKQSSIEVLCFTLLFCCFISYSFMLYFLLSVLQHLSLYTRERCTALYWIILFCFVVSYPVFLLMQTDKCCDSLRS